eukprot:2315382-Prymnesium_polylepis.2
MGYSMFPVRVAEDVGQARQHRGEGEEQRGVIRVTHSLSLAFETATLFIIHVFRNGKTQDARRSDEALKNHVSWVIDPR